MHISVSISSEKQYNFVIRHQTLASGNLVQIQGLPLFCHQILSKVPNPEEKASASSYLYKEDDNSLYVAGLWRELNELKQRKHLTQSFVFIRHSY